MVPNTILETYIVELLLISKFCKADLILYYFDHFIYLTCCLSINDSVNLIKLQYLIVLEMCKNLKYCDKYQPVSCVTNHVIKMVVVKIF